MCSSDLLILSCKEDLAREFEMKDLGLLHYFLGLEIWQRSDGLFVSQGKYAREILERFSMHGCKPVDTPLPGGWRKEDVTSAEVVVPLFIDSWWGRLCIWSIHDPIYAMLLTSFCKLWLSLPSSFGRRGSMY